MPNNARRKKLNRYQGAKGTLGEKPRVTQRISQERETNVSVSRQTKITYLVYIDDITDSDNVGSVAEVIWNIASMTQETAKDKAERAYSLSTFINSTEDEDLAQSWKRYLERAGATVSIRKS